MNIDGHKTEGRLKSGKVLGLNLTGNIPVLGLTIAPSEFGYIEVRRTYVSPVTPCDPETEREGYLRWLTFKAETERNPYHVHIAIVREMPEEKKARSNDFPDNDDYLFINNYDVSSITEVEEILNRHGKSLAEAKPLRELRLP